MNGPHPATARSRAGAAPAMVVQANNSYLEHNLGVWFLMSAVLAQTTLHNGASQSAKTTFVSSHISSLIFFRFLLPLLAFSVIL